MPKKTREAAVIEAVETADSLNGRGTVTLANGVKLAVRPVPRHFIYEVTKRFEAPKVPMFFNQDKGREEPNPEDPDYQAEAQKYLGDVANATTDVAFLRGTAVVEIPDDVPGPDSPEWREEMEVLGYPLIENRKARYLSWLKGISTDEDINRVLAEVGRLTGASEEDVAEAVKRFRRLTPRDKD